MILSHHKTQKDWKIFPNVYVIENVKMELWVFLKVKHVELSYLLQRKIWIKPKEDPFYDMLVL